MYALLGQNQVIQKVCLIGQPQKDCAQYPFLHLKNNPFMAPTMAGGRGSTHSLEIVLTLVQIFYENIMITLARDLIHNCYIHQQIRDNQAVLIISSKNNSTNF
jgi:hypothetical protein